MLTHELCQRPRSADRTFARPAIHSTESFIMTDALIAGRLYGKAAERTAKNAVSQRQFGPGGRFKIWRRWPHERCLSCTDVKTPSPHKS